MKFELAISTLSMYLYNLQMVVERDVRLRSQITTNQYTIGQSIEKDLKEIQNLKEAIECLKTQKN